MYAIVILDKILRSVVDFRLFFKYDDLLVTDKCVQNYLNKLFHLIKNASIHTQLVQITMQR